MNLRLIVPLAIGTLAITGMVYTFVTQASPYVTVAQAKTTEGNNLHLPGALLKETLQISVRERQVRFTLQDDEGDKIPVLYNGNAPANMTEATRVVVIGGFKEGVFVADKMLLKCPSKYESEIQGSRNAKL